MKLPNRRDSRKAVRWRNYAALVVVIGVCGLVGLALLQLGHAATTTANIEAENGTVSSAATEVNDSQASGSAAVLFGTGSSSPSITGLRQNWPCSGCLTYIPSTYTASKPSALLVALHGDEGTPTTIESYWQATAAKDNVILFTPHCPISLGCNFDNGNGTTTSSWWEWLQASSGYSDAWIGQQVNTLAKSYTLDTNHEYLTGWSGGADYLGDYALLHGNRFAAVAYVVGGVPYVQSCPANGMAAYFLMGSADFRYTSGQPSQVKSVFDNCGDTTKLVVLQGEDHQGTINALISQGYADTIMTWLLARSL